MFKNFRDVLKFIINNGGSITRLELNRLKFFTFDTELFLRHCKHNEYLIEIDIGIYIVTKKGREVNK